MHIVYAFLYSLDSNLLVYCIHATRRQWIVTKFAIAPNVHCKHGYAYLSAMTRVHSSGHGQLKNSLPGRHAFLSPSSLPLHGGNFGILLDCDQITRPYR